MARSEVDSKLKEGAKQGSKDTGTNSILMLTYVVVVRR
jgi:hypothetical protein